MEFSSQVNLLKSLPEQLSPLRGKRVFFERLEGNNGDKLITMGSLELLQQVGAKLVNHPKQAESIVINGGGGMTDVWSFGFKAIREYNTLYPQIPLFILSSSFSFTKTDFPSLFRNRTAPAFIYVREAYSLKLLEDFTFPTDVRLGIDHDMAFQLQDTSYIQYLKNCSANNHILIVERNDPEGVTSVCQPRKSTWKSRIPWSVKRPINHNILWPLKRMKLYSQMPKMGIHTSFAQEWQKQLLTNHPELEGLPVCAADISNPEICGFDRFGQLVAEAAAIVTTRLHVGILAAMLDKPVYLKCGSYHKIKGIYEHSLASKQNVNLIP